MSIFDPVGPRDNAVRRKAFMSKHPTIAEHLEASGVSRRSFLQLCGMLMASAPVGLALTGKGSVLQVAEAIGKTRRPSVIWLHFQDCTGCTETLLRTSAPDVAHLILDVISLDYHETHRWPGLRNLSRFCEPCTPSIPAWLAPATHSIHQADRLPK